MEREGERQRDGERDREREGEGERRRGIADISALHPQEGSILSVAYNSEGWQEAGLWEDPCVRIGWIQGLRSMLQHRLALHFLVQRGVCLGLSELDKQRDISSLEQPPSLILNSGVSACCISVFNVGPSGLTKPLLQLQTDPSLFVASAANQLLAHLVVFFQPMGSSVEQGEAVQADASTDNSPEHLAVAMATGPEHLNVAMATNAEHACVTVAIIDHLQESLTSDQHLQTLQSLRLLGLLLSQARAPLWGTLLRRVPGFLEPLVRAGRSQLMLQLTDVLLTAYRSVSLVSIATRGLQVMGQALSVDTCETTHSQSYERPSNVIM